jgi:hypothetical protein
MPYSSTYGASRGAKRTGRWFLLVFLCMVLILAVVPAVSLGHCTSKCIFWNSKVVLSSPQRCVTAGSSVKLTAFVTMCPAKATIALQTLGSTGTWTTVATGTPKCGTACFNVTVTCKTSFRAVLTSSKGTVISNTVCVCVAPKLTVGAKPGQYAGGICISGTLTPAETGNVCITITRPWHCFFAQVVARLSVPLTAGPAGSSSYAVTWAGGVKNTCYTITASVPKTPSLGAACASTHIKL